MSLLSLLDPRTIISAFGVLGVTAIIFAETGLFVGFFLPGDSLLFTAGLLASQGYIAIGWLLAGAAVAAIVGDSVGYAFGKKVGPALFSREDSKLFRKENVAKAQHFYEKHGGYTIVISRFIPVIRTFAPIVAGIGRMHYRKFLSFNIAGGLIWTIVLTLLGYGFGSIIPDPDHYILPAVAVIIIISALPALREFLKRRKG